jgi:hypothetical protein
MDLSGCARPADACAKLNRKKQALEKRERTLLDIQTGSDPSLTTDPRHEAELAAVQSALRTLCAVKRRLEEYPDQPLEVFPHRCRPRRGASDRARGHRLHKTLGREGIADHYAFAADVLGRRRVKHFRHLSEDQVDQVREAALVSAGRYGPTEIATKMRRAGAEVAR